MICSPTKKDFLSNLKSLKQTRFRDIAVDTSRSYKYHLLNEFEKKGLIRKKIDNGVTLISITEKGKTISDILNNNFSGQSPLSSQNFSKIGL